MSPGEVTMPLERLPPRAALPRDVTVEALPGLGTTWYDRGGAYWRRRVGMALMWALLITLVTLIVTGLLSAIRQTSQTGFYVALGVEIAWSLAIIGWFAAGTARHWNNPAPPPRLGLVSRRARRAGAAGAAAGALARSGLLLGQAFLVFGSLIFLGLYVAMFLSALLPETPVERQARLRLTEKLRVRGYAAPAGQPGNGQG